MILFVCQANICRSPLAERLTWHLSHGLRAESAGTHARAGDPMHPAARELLAAAGADTTAFGSRRVTAALVAGAGLVLTATRAQRAHCVTLAPAALGRTFTIRQFGRLAAAVDPGRITATEARPRLAEVLAEVARARGAVQPGEDDLADPANGTAADMRACAQTIEAALRPVLALIAVP